MNRYGLKLNCKDLLNVRNIVDLFLLLSYSLSSHSSYSIGHYGTVGRWAVLHQLYVSSAMSSFTIITADSK